MDLYMQELEGKAKAELEQFKAFGKHFSHDHPLSLTIPSEEYDDKSCSICGLPIFSSPYYNCTFCTTISYKFFLHHQCALNLPHYLHMPTYCDSRLIGHVLFLRKAKQSLSSSSSDFNYECKYCSIKILPLSAGVGVEIKIKHRSHPLHTLVATHKKVSCECDGCGRKHKGFFFTCSKGCNFWIHRDCTLLPNIITLLDQPYPFFLAYSLSPYQISDKHCAVCRKPLLARSSNLGVYLCPQSGRFAHVPCGAHDKSTSKTTSGVMMQLPEEERDEFPSRAIRRYAETIVGTSTDDDRQTIESCHKQHPLILIINNADTSTKKKNKRKVLLACDLCTQPIDTSSSSPFHRCRDTACQFAAHKICADILPGITKSFLPGTLVNDVGNSTTNHLGTPVFFNSVFYCHFCRRPCNGAYTYALSPLYGSRFRQPLHIDLECMAAPITINHASHSHPQHILFRTHSSPSVGDATHALSCCTADTLFYDIYRCLDCNYSIHISCAMLPKRLHFPQYHRRHPLCLIYGNIDGGHDFCEVCEEVIDLRYWLYRCIECNESYHINCIPSVGYLSKVKFGGTLTLPSSVHVHPLTLERMLDVPSQRCGDCKEIIHGMVDEMAFFCSLCHFWLHFSCAGKSASDPLPLYSDVSLQNERSILKYYMSIRSN